MAENDRINDGQAEHSGDEVEDLLDGITDRIGQTMEGIAELADDIEEVSADIDQFEKGVSHVKRLEDDVVKLIMGIIAYIPRMKTCHCWER